MSIISTTFGHALPATDLPAAPSRANARIQPPRRPACPPSPQSPVNLRALALGAPRWPDTPGPHRAETCAAFTASAGALPIPPGDSLRAKSRHCSARARRLTRDLTRASTSLRSPASPVQPPLLSVPARLNRETGDEAIRAPRRSNGVSTISFRCGDCAPAAGTSAKLNGLTPQTIRV